MGGEKAPGSVPKEIKALYLLHLISVKSDTETVRKGPGQRGVSSAHLSRNKQCPTAWERGEGDCVPGLLSPAARWGVLPFVWVMQAHQQGFPALTREIIADSSVTGSSPAPK